MRVSVRRGRSCERPGEVVAPHVPHRDIEMAVRLAGLIDRNDIGMIQRRGKTGLAEEPLAKICILSASSSAKTFKATCGSAAGRWPHRSMPCRHGPNRPRHDRRRSRCRPQGMATCLARFENRIHRSPVHTPTKSLSCKAQRHPCGTVPALFAVPTADRAAFSGYLQRRSTLLCGSSGTSATLVVPRPGTDRRSRRRVKLGMIPPLVSTEPDQHLGFWISWAAIVSLPVSQANVIPRAAPCPLAATPARPRDRQPGQSRSAPTGISRDTTAASPCGCRP